MNVSTLAGFDGQDVNITLSNGQERRGKLSTDGLSCSMECETVTGKTWSVQFDPGDIVTIEQKISESSF